MEVDNIINTKFIQKVLILLSFFSLFISFTVFKETYGKYVTDINESTNIKIARWRILLNGEDVRNSSTSTTIAPVFVGNNNIQNNVIAPHAEGYFDIIIDGSNADVAFKYDIDIKVSEESSVKDLIITGYKIDENEKVLTNETTLSNTVLLNQQSKLINIRFYIKWNDEDGATMDNEADTIATMTNVDAKLDVSLKFTQVVE